MCGRSLGTFGQVALHVQGQVIGTGEAALAHLAAERLGARVFAVVARQLVGARETPLTFRPVASVRLFACQKTKLHFYFSRPSTRVGHVTNQFAQNRRSSCGG